MRFVRIGDQICEGNDDFAFWDTVCDKFFCVDGDKIVFSSIADLERYRGYARQPTDHRPRSWEDMIAMASSAGVRQQDPED